MGQCCGKYCDGEMLNDKITSQKLLNSDPSISQNLTNIEIETGQEESAENMKMEGDMAHDLKLIAFYELDRGNPEKALQLCRQVHRIQEVVLGQYHPDTLKSLGDTGIVLEAQKRFDEAFQIHQQVYARMRMVLGDDHVDTVTAQKNMAAVMLKQPGGGKQKKEEAVEMLKQVFEKFKKIYGKDHMETMTVLGLLASGLAETKNYKVALVLMDIVCQFMTQNLGPQHPKTRVSLRDLEVTKKRAKVEEKRRKMKF